MFIEIADECIELINEDKYYTFFNQLAYYMNNGRHYIFLSKKFLETLFKNKKLDYNVKNVYKKMFDNSCEDLIIKKSVNRIIRVTKEIELVRKNNEIYMPLEFAIEIDLFNNKSNLIGENTSDCNFFHTLGEIYKNCNSIVGINIEMQTCNGGGGSMFEVCIGKSTDREFSITIVDSDQKYEGAPKGGTMKKVLRDTISQYNEIYPLYVHEIENLIPIKMIENYYSTNRGESDKSDTIELLKKLKQDAVEKSPLAYFAMKNGITKNKWDSDENYRTYWKSMLDKVDYKYSGEGDIIQGFGNRFLSKLCAYMNKEKTNSNFYENNVDDYLEKIWKEIGQIIYSYGCARQRECFFR